MAGMSEKNYIREKKISSNTPCDFKNPRDKCLNVSFTDERKRRYNWPQMQNIVNVSIACIFNNRKNIIFKNIKIMDTTVIQKKGRRNVFFWACEKMRKDQDTQLRLIKIYKHDLGEGLEHNSPCFLFMASSVLNSPFMHLLGMGQ